MTDAEHMIAYQLKSRGIFDKPLLAAMGKIPRERFVPDSWKSRAYDDSPLPIGFGQTISQPYIVALMTEALQIKAGQKVLEIGTGCGYQTAILAELGAQVYTVELLAKLSQSARLLLLSLGYSNIEYKVGDGHQGWEEKSPYDAILVAAAPEVVPPKLIAQLAPGGRLVIPVGPRRGVQNLDFFEKMRDNSVTKNTLLNVRFVPLLEV